MCSGGDQSQPARATTIQRQTCDGRVTKYMLHEKRASTRSGDCSSLEQECQQPPTNHCKPFANGRLLDRPIQ